ncbi:MAG: RsmE family RNA methyltransferase [Candidatus Acidiferrales bacterium]
MRRRFFVDRFENTTAVLRGDAAEHLGRVLRAEPGQLYELSDGQCVWLARIERATLSKRGDNRIEFSLVEPVPCRAPSLELHLLVALVKFDRFELCLEKATELGAHEIVPLAASRSDRPLIAAAAKRSQRWRKILIESAQQSRRLRPPILREVATAEDAFTESRASTKIFFSERPGVPAIRAVLKSVSAGRSFSSDMIEAYTKGALAHEAAVNSEAGSAAIAIGPEGGWTDAEISAARSAGFLEVSLGANILRTETAVAAALAIVRFILDPDG